MSLFDKWFGEKKTPGGSNLIRHSRMERQFGFTEKAADFQPTREAAYTQLFGEALTVSHELLPQIPHIDVYTFRRELEGKTVYSLVTGGMSDLEMTLPRGVKEVPRRVELIFYCAEPREEYIATLRWLAHFPHDAKSWLCHTHTVANGNPPKPFSGRGDMDALLFLPPIVTQDQGLPEKLQLGESPLAFSGWFRLRLRSAI